MNPQEFKIKLKEVIADSEEIEYDWDGENEYSYYRITPDNACFAVIRFLKTIDNLSECVNAVQND